MAIYRAALPRLRRRLGASRYEVAVTLNNLGCALALKERPFGRSHAEVAIGLNNLAIFRRRPGPSHPGSRACREHLRRLGD